MSQQVGNCLHNSAQLTVKAMMLKRLKRYGISGILYYGLLNTAYYIPTFLVVWFYVSPTPRKMGFVAAIERLFKVMAMVWAGSQVTKLARAGGAVALAPFVERGLSWFSTKFKFDSQGGFHGNCWVLFWNGNHSIFCRDIAEHVKMCSQTFLTYLHPISFRDERCFAILMHA